MVRLGKGGTIILFLFSLGAIICALKVVGRFEEKREEIASLSLSLDGTKKELTDVIQKKEALEEELKRQRVSLQKLQEELKQEKKLREELKESMNQKVAALKKDLEEEREKKVSLEKEFRKLKMSKNLLEDRFEEAHQKWLALKKMVEEAAPEVKGEVSPEVTPALLSKEIGGRVSYIYSPFLSIELEKEAAGDSKPTILVYRDKELIKQVKTKQIHYITMVARISDETSLEGIVENDQVRLNFLPGVKHLLESEKLSGKIWAVQSPGFLTVALGGEAALTISPALSIYRDDRLVKEMKLGRIDPVTIVVEAADEKAIKGIREKDRVELIEGG